MTGLFLSAWLAFPLLLLATSAGCGLLVRRVSGGALSGVLLLPTGFSLVVAIATLGTSVTWLAPSAGAIAVTIAGVSLLLELWPLRHARLRVPVEVAYPAVAALVAFAAIAAPVVLTGTPSWTGFARITDTANQMGFAQHLSEVGRQVPVGNSAFNDVMLGLSGNGYPGGAQAALGALAGVIHTETAWCYQAYQAWAAAMGALAAYALLRTAVASRLMSCIGAAVAIQANILYDYGLEGGIKELTTASLILLVVALLAEQLPGPRSLRSALPLAPALAAALATFSYGLAPWLGPVLLIAFVASLVASKRLARTTASWAVAACVTAILAIPTVIAGVKLFGTVKTAVTSSVELGLGNLTAPIPEISAVGVWISNDYRFPHLARAGTSHAFDILVIALAVVGVAGALWKRRWVVAAAGITAPIALAYVVAHAGPWLELKAFTLTAPLFLATAFVGAGWLVASRARRIGAVLRVAGWVGAVAVTGAVLYGNALTYHDMSLAPAARYTQLAAIGKRFAGISPAFYPAFDEYSEYFLRREGAFDLNIPPPLKVRPGAVTLAPGTFAYAYDLNQFELSFVQDFPLLVLARSPVASRPPANFDIVDQTSEFEVWRRVRSASEVVAHLPLSGLPAERTQQFCLLLLHTARRAGPGSLVAYVPAGPRAVLVPTLAKHPSYWHAFAPEALRAYGAGAVEGSLVLPASGTYEVSMPGSVGRPITLYVDGHRAGSIAYQERYPGQYLRFGRVSLSAGVHTVRLVRGSGDLHPGDGDGPDTSSGVIGRVTFTLERPQNGRLKVVPRSQAARVCAAHEGYQWMEVLAPGARSASV
jgi:hypothetical protein